MRIGRPDVRMGSVAALGLLAALLPALGATRSVTTSVPAPGRRTAIVATAAVWASGAVAAEQAVPAGPAGDTAGAVGPELLRYARAAREEDRPLDWYNYGTALLREGRPESAAEALRRALDAERPRLRRFGRYNSGLAEASAARETAEPGARRSRLLAARDAFREVLRQEPGDEEARWNLEVVQRWLDREPREGAGSDGGGGDSGGQRGSGRSAALGSEEAGALLDAAGRAESGVRERLLRRTRFRDPVVEKNW